LGVVACGTEKTGIDGLEAEWEKCGDRPSDESQAKERKWKGFQGRRRGRLG
jgi:hypothetical protein